MFQPAIRRTWLGKNLRFVEVAMKSPTTKGANAIRNPEQSPTYGTENRHHQQARYRLASYFQNGNDQ
jgi:hypothetical protein